MIRIVKSSSTIRTRQSNCFRKLATRFDIIIMRSFGNIDLLLPDMVEAGITGLWMTDMVPSNMDYVAIRKKYGQKLQFITDDVSQESTAKLFTETAYNERQ